MYICPYAHTPLNVSINVRSKKENMCVSDRPTLTFFMPKKIIDRQNPEIRLFLCFVYEINNRPLTVAILTLSDKRLIEMDLLLKTGFLFEFSSFPCTFDFRGRSILVSLKKNPYLPTLILKTMQSETYLFFYLALNGSETEILTTFIKPVNKCTYAPTLTLH